MQTTNNTILITGGSSGIGLAMVQQFYQLGNKIIITARDAGKLQEAKKIFPDIEVFKADLARQAHIDALLLFVEQMHPGLNVLINNAGIQYNYHFADEPSLIPKIDQEISVNLTATIKLCGLLLPVLTSNPFPAIVNVSSGLALSPKRTAPVYCATRAAVHHFTKALRYQMETTGVKVFEILPPVVDTPMTAGRSNRKISPRQLAAEFIKDFKNDRYKSYIGKAKLLKIIHRLSPALADRMMKKG